jgi:hypothetical protein
MIGGQDDDGCIRVVSVNDCAAQRDGCECVTTARFFNESGIIDVGMFSDGAV